MVLDNFMTKSLQKGMQDVQGGESIGEFGCQGIENGAKDCFRVRVPDGMVVAIGGLGSSNQGMCVSEFRAFAIVAKGHLHALPDSHKGMHIFERDAALSGVSDVSHHVCG